MRLFNHFETLVLTFQASNIVSSALFDQSSVNGLGRPLTLSSKAQVEKQQMESSHPTLSGTFHKRILTCKQFTYSAHLFYALTLTFAKLSAAMLLRSITPKKTHRSMAVFIGSAVALWAFISLFAMAFQCDMPHPWMLQQERCSNIVSITSHFNARN